MAYKHDEKASGQLVRSVDWNTMGHAIEGLDTAKVERAGDTITGDLTVNGKISAPAAQFTTSLDVTGAATLGSLSVGGTLTAATIAAPNIEASTISTGILQASSGVNAAVITAGQINSAGLATGSIMRGAPFRIHSGFTSASDWQVYQPNGITVRVDTSAAGFVKTPLYVISLHGLGSHWTTAGGSSVYYAAPGSFTVFIKWVDSSPLTPATAAANGWHIVWIGIES